ncbi:hypothetical protein [Demequina sp.]|uniref:hypothetical protein n=1 Tax=Demequina sp. TaxID=2050685 RepID=UPI003A8C6241
MLTPTLVVRFTDEGKTRFSSTVPALVRTSARFTIILGVVLGAMFSLPFVMWVAGRQSGMSAAVPGWQVALLVAAPVAIAGGLVAVGVRRYRTVPDTPDLAVTITPGAVVFPAMPLPGVRGIQREATEFPRAWTTARELAVKPGQAAVVEFVEEPPQGKRRVRRQATQFLDASAEQIVAAVNADGPSR